MFAAVRSLSEGEGLMGSLKAAGAGRISGAGVPAAVGETGRGGIKSGGGVLGWLSDGVEGGV